MPVSLRAQLRSYTLPSWVSTPLDLTFVLASASGLVPKLSPREKRVKADLPGNN